MKGVILAGGLATRLRPLTWVTNKHLLPIYNKPMIYYPLESLVKAGIKEILISTSPDHAGQFANLLKSGDEFGVKLYYSVQENPKGGIANAIGLAEEFAKGEKITVVLGDNIFNYDLKSTIEKFKQKEKGAMVFGIRMLGMESKHYGVIEIDKSGRVISVEEKPENPKSNIAQTGIYIYDERVFNFIKKQKTSNRGELEVTDLNNFYLKEGSLECALLDWWIDAGTSHDELLRANNLVAEKVKTGQL
ncbi:spore coat protein [Candidatus Roizmanbacteria bacterium CG_4_10_14_0_2_um_filter_36_35]|uniref:glucose-1-phosphate thymidylyltransferase n=4 Tax=Candidatus Roizmaniibacteriota TaxID=1752723 RepID=A0A2M7BX04_9BACT|nr:MAG: spore coat protein [Candidatus Roizmanbacteria bacterium CG11_big_fil_rev_8_21_14_0_20_35_14]PIV11075.1 MAG: spore coat protein [Candidatus Roizmanbacteria bacterium CG03_land_8_20_14_0_80_35_26]PIZ67894.1 MAG: spore coat protein [Candidatus Roizmanbacteria bacterium CG_4_10_14_0_2_um_filter_36_35]PJC32800.1 MAG: spore coat protein [Candidatus Roizmanbacteria bacterium CG_4_9_14_0_2_um_filter_36_12]PJC80998.1 MAG: spore coat protein [Candidatus Roizmanbacteria bacterium CG_4_8_14_3_um_f